MGVVSKAERIALRVASIEKARLEKAAQLQHLTLSEFMLSASRQAAEAVLGDQTRFILPAKDMKALEKALDAAPRSIPKLKALFARQSVLKA